MLLTINSNSADSSLVYSNTEEVLTRDARVEDVVPPRTPVETPEKSNERNDVDIVIANNDNPNMVDIPTPKSEQKQNDPVIGHITYTNEAEIEDAEAEMQDAESGIQNTEDIKNAEADIQNAKVDTPNAEADTHDQLDNPGEVTEREVEEVEYDEPNYVGGVVDAPENDYVAEPAPGDRQQQVPGDRQQQEPESVEYSDVQALQYSEDKLLTDDVEPEPDILEMPELKEEVVARDIDEYGNLLDENGHPIIKHAFPRTWEIQEDQGDGIIRFETPEGPVRFIMELGYEYENPPNEYKLQMDCYLKEIPTTHQIADGCHFFVDNGIWRLELDVEFINILLRMDVIKDFEDVTGDVIWNDSKDITIENLTKLVQIYTDSSYNEHPPRWLLMKDAKYNPKDNLYLLSDGTQIVNKTRNMNIAVGMNMVESKTSFQIPEPDLTEMKNIKTFLIYDTTELVEHQVKYLDSEGCYVKEMVTRHIFYEDSTLEDQGKRHLINEDCKLEEQGKRHLLYEDAEKVDIIRDVVLNSVDTIENITREYVIVEDSDRVDIKRHNFCLEQDIVRTPAVWDDANFDGELVDLSTMRLEHDIKMVVSPSKFKLNQIEVDEEYLQEEDED